MHFPEPFKLERYFARHEFNVRHLLSSSDCESLRMDELLKLADKEMRNSWSTLGLGYTQTAGHPLLRTEIAQLYEHVTPEGVLEVVPSEGIFLVQQALLAPGGHVIVVTPAYQSLTEIALAIGCDVTPWPLRASNGGWHLDIEALHGLVRPDTKLLVTNFPHNPTGFLPSPDEWRAILAEVRAHDLWLLSDEMYRLLEYSPADRLPAAADVYERAVSLSGLSKSFGLPGLRVGWLATRSKELLERCQQLKDYTTICASAPSEVLATIALRARETITADCLGRVREGLDHVEQFCKARPHLFRWLPPRAGSVVFPAWIGPLSLDVLQERALEKGVMVLTGDLFHTPDYLRFGLGRRGLTEALEVFASILPT